MSGSIQHFLNGSRLKLVRTSVEVVRCAPGMTFPLHRHERSFIAVVIYGAFESRGSRINLACSPGTIAVIEAGEFHRNRVPDSGSTQLLVSLRNDAPWPRSFTAPRHRLAINGNATAIASTIAAELRIDDDYSSLAVECGVSELLNLWERHVPESRRPPPWLRNVVQHLNDSAGLRPSLAELAAHSGVHASYLSRVFRQCFGCSIASYARARRLEAAVMAIQCSRSNLAEVALSCGFADQSHMTRAFSSTYGCTPRTVRNSYGDYAPGPNMSIKPSAR